MKAYLDLLKYIIENGDEKEDRTNTGTISSFGHQLEFNLEHGFPAVTTKSLAWKGVVSELLWFLEGSDDERRLAEIRFNKDRSELKDLEKFYQVVYCGMYTWVLYILLVVTGPHRMDCGVTRGYF